MKKITLYFMPDRRITVRIPKGYIPDRATIENISEIIRIFRKETVM